MGRYAEATSVSSEKSRADIERTLNRYGADQFMYGWRGDSALVAFRLLNRQVRFILPMPSKEDAEFTTTETGRARKPPAALAAWEQATRQRWRALALVIKAKLEAVESGITVFDEEFLAHIVLPDGSTVGETAIPRIAAAYESGKMPNLLPHLKD